MFMFYAICYQPKTSPARPVSLLQPKVSSGATRQQPNRTAKRPPTHTFHEKDAEDNPDSWNEVDDETGSKRTTVHDTGSITRMNHLVSSILKCYMFCYSVNML